LTPLPHDIRSLTPHPVLYGCIVRYSKPDRSMSEAGHSRPSKSALAPPFVGYAPDSDRRRCNAANAATCQTRHLRRPDKQDAMPVESAL